MKKIQKTAIAFLIISILTGCSGVTHSVKEDKEKIYYMINYMAQKGDIPVRGSHTIFATAPIKPTDVAEIMKIIHENTGLRNIVVLSFSKYQ